MSLKVADLTDKKTYLAAVQKHAKQANGRFCLFETKYDDGSKARLLVFGAHLALLRKHLEAKKAALLDDGGILDGGIFLSRTGKLTDKIVEELKLDGIVKVTHVGDKADKADKADKGGKPDARTAAPKPTAPPVDPDSMVPMVNMTVRALLADLADRQRKAAAIRHPGLRADAEQLSRQMIGWVTNGKFKDIDKEYTKLQQIQVDARVADEVATELAQVGTALKARNDDDELDALKMAQAYYNAGQFAACRAELKSIHKLLGPMPYGPTGTPADAQLAAKAARLGSLAAAYADEKDRLEKQLGKILADRRQFANYVDEATKVKAFIDKSASLGLRRQVEAIERENDPAKRKKLVEKAIVVVQAYLTAFVRQASDAPQIGKDYLAALRHLHAELTRLHH